MRPLTPMPPRTVSGSGLRTQSPPCIVVSSVLPKSAKSMFVAFRPCAKAAVSNPIWAAVKTFLNGHHLAKQDASIVAKQIKLALTVHYGHGHRPVWLLRSPFHHCAGGHFRLFQFYALSLAHLASPPIIPLCFLAS